VVVDHSWTLRLVAARVPADVTRGHFAKSTHCLHVVSSVQCKVEVVGSTPAQGQLLNWKEGETLLGKQLIGHIEHNFSFSQCQNSHWSKSHLLSYPKDTKLHVNLCNNYPHLAKK
jgi:hypothetical protein